MSKTLQKIAADFIKLDDERNKRGCYVTPDGTVFYRNYSGLQYARSHAGDPKKVQEYDENAELVSVQDPNLERQNLVAKITESPTNSYGAAQLANMSNESLRKLWSDLTATSKQKQTPAPDQGKAKKGESSDGDEINIDRLSKSELIELLNELDPTYEVTKETKNQLKDAIVKANAFDGFDSKKLAEIILALDPAGDRIQLDMSDEAIVGKFDNDELKAIALYLRDEIELDPELDEKIHSLDPEGLENDPKGAN